MFTTKYMDAITIVHCIYHYILPFIMIINSLGIILSIILSIIDNDRATVIPFSFHTHFVFVLQLVYNCPFIDVSQS